jgi:hypothetical protein
MNAQSWWIAAGLLGSAACWDNAPQSEEGSVHLALTIGSQDGSGPIHAVLSLNVTADGSASGTIAALGWPTSPTEVSGTVKAGLLTLDPDELGITFSDSVGWNSFELRARNGVLSDGADGVADAKLLTADWDTWEVHPYSATLTAGPDVQGEGAGVYESFARFAQYDTLLPCDGIDVRLGEPTDLTQAAMVRVLADQTPLAGALSPIVVDDMASVLSFAAPAFWPFGATLSVDPNGVTDPSGNQLVVGPKLKVDADPGAAIANAGFEGGLAGWIAKGSNIKQVAAFNGIAPAEGDHQIVVGAASQLAGYVDIPATAGALSLSIGLLGNDRESSFFAVNATVTLHGVTGQPLEMFDASKVVRQAEPCTDCDRAFQYRVPAARYSVDVTPYRGQRVFVTTQVASAQGSSTKTLVVDDLRVE